MNHRSNSRSEHRKNLRFIKQVERETLKKKKDDHKKHFKSIREAEEEKFSNFKPFDTKRMERAIKHCVFRFKWFWWSKMKRQWLEKNKFLLEATDNDGKPDYKTRLVWVYVYREIKRTGMLPDKLPYKLIRSARRRHEKTLKSV